MWILLRIPSLSVALKLFIVMHVFMGRGKWMKLPGAVKHSVQVIGVAVLWKCIPWEPALSSAVCFCFRAAGYILFRVLFWFHPPPLISQHWLLKFTQKEPVINNHLTKWMLSRGIFLCYYLFFGSPLDWCACHFLGSQYFVLVLHNYLLFVAEDRLKCQKNW